VSVPTSIPAEAAAAAARRLEPANAGFARRYPGESGRRQPAHTVYGGAHLFHSDSPSRLGALALHTLAEFAPTPDVLASALLLARPLADLIYPRVVEKLRREPVEDFRIDFEDGYGNRPDAEEDGHAVAAAREVAAGLAAGTLPPSIGIRIKPFTAELSRRSFRTLDAFVTQLSTDTGGRLPADFVVTLAKVTVPEQVAALSDLLEALEGSLGLPEGSLHSEIMIETPQAIVSERGAIALLRLVEAGRGRCRAAHFGIYDYTASLAITAAHQHMAHPSGDFARDMMQVALAGTGVWLSDGATNILPIPPHRQAERTLTGREVTENREAVHAAWRLHYGHVRRSLERGYYQGWDLHPAQLPTRYAALYAFFQEGLDAASARLRNFVEKAGEATLVGEVFDDAATGQGLLNFFLRAWNCGAITETEALEKSGLTLEELSGRSFLRILEARRR